MQQRVQGPAIALIVAGVLGILTTLAWAAALGIVVPQQIEALERELNEPVLPGLVYGAHGVSILISLACGACSLWAGLQMRRLQHWVVCVVACFVAMIPCFTCCCLGIPVGIWGLVVLLNDEVKEAFTS